MMEDDLSKGIGILDDRLGHTWLGQGQGHQPLHIDLHAVIDGLML